MLTSKATETKAALQRSVQDIPVNETSVKEQKDTTNEAVVPTARQIELCPSPARTTYSLFLRVAGGSAGRPASKLCFHSIGT